MKTEFSNIFIPQEKGVHRLKISDDLSNIKVFLPEKLENGKLKDLIDSNTFFIFAGSHQGKMSFIGINAKHQIMFRITRYHAKKDIFYYDYAGAYVLDYDKMQHVRTYYGGW